MECLRDLDLFSPTLRTLHIRRANNAATEGGWQLADALMLFPHLECFSISAPLTPNVLSALPSTLTKLGVWMCEEQRDLEVVVHSLLSFLITRPKISTLLLMDDDFPIHRPNSKLESNPILDSLQARCNAAGIRVQHVAWNNFWTVIIPR